MVAGRTLLIAAFDHTVAFAEAVVADIAPVGLEAYNRAVAVVVHLFEAAVDRTVVAAVDRTVAAAAVAVLVGSEKNYHLEESLKER